jgi:hypothetical protein
MCTSQSSDAVKVWIGRECAPGSERAKSTHDQDRDCHDQDNPVRALDSHDKGVRNMILLAVQKSFQAWLLSDELKNAMFKVCRPQNAVSRE